MKWISSYNHWFTLTVLFNIYYFNGFKTKWLQSLDCHWFLDSDWKWVAQWLKVWATYWSVVSSNPTIAVLPLLGLWVRPLTLNCSFVPCLNCKPLQDSVIHQLRPDWQDYLTFFLFMGLHKVRYTQVDHTCLQIWICFTWFWLMPGPNAAASRTVWRIPNHQITILSLEHLRMLQPARITHCCIRWCDKEQFSQRCCHLKGGKNPTC